MKEYERVIYKPNEAPDSEGPRIVRADDEFIFSDGKLTKKISGEEVIKTGKSMVNIPYENRPIQNIYAQGEILYYIIAEPPSNKIFFDLKNTQYSLNFTAPFSIGIFKDHDDGNQMNGRIILGSFVLPYSMEHMIENYGPYEPHGYNWILGDNLVSRVIYDDQEFRSLTLKGIEYDEKSHIMKGKLLFDVYVPHIQSSPISSPYDFMINFDAGEFAINGSGFVRKYNMTS